MRDGALLKNQRLLSMVNGMERRPWQVPHLPVIMFAICVMGLLSFSRVEAARDGAVEPNSFTVGTLGKVDESALKYDVVGQALLVPPGSSTASNIYRDIPSISGDYLGGGTKLTPYIGAGFGSGYVSDVDRSLSGSVSPSTNSGSRSHFGQGLTPSEFQMGIRIPF